MILEKLNILIRNRYGSLEFGDENLSKDEIINKYLNYTDEKVEKNHVCLLREYVDDDTLFKEKLKLLEPKLSFFKVELSEDTCVECRLDCFSNLSNNVYSSISMFIIEVHNMGFCLSKRDRKQLSIEFLNQFYILNNVWCSSFERITKLFFDYYLVCLSEGFKGRTSLENLKDLYDAKDLLFDLKIRISNLGEIESLEEDSFFNVLNKFFNNKIEYFKEIKALEKEEGGSSLFSDLPQFEFINNFDEVESNVVYDYFKNSLVKKGYLSNEDLEKYLILAFQNKELPKKRFVFLKQDISGITNIFYIYYKEVVEKRHGKQSIYAELLGNYFEGFQSDKVVNNFARHYYKVRK
ncbi:hypothetical protein [Polaribacter staleyi]|uniref:hypothetical protein n=1 Tax=Polaribacter staleyi TaxID=2022337 RepID=UPI0031BA2CC1